MVLACSRCPWQCASTSIISTLHGYAHYCNVATFETLQKLTQGLNREQLPGGCLAGTPEGEGMVKPLSYGGVDHLGIDQSGQVQPLRAHGSRPSQRAGGGEMVGSWQGPGWA